MCRNCNGSRRYRFCRNEGYDLKQDTERKESDRQGDKGSRCGNRIAPDVRVPKRAAHGQWAALSLCISRLTWGQSGGIIITLF